MVEGLPVIKATTGICKGCVIGKHPKHKFDRAKENQATSILGMIHSDINGTMPITSMNGSRYLLTFINYFSRYTWVFFLKKKSEVCEKFSELKAYWQATTLLNFLAIFPNKIDQISSLINY